MNKSRSLILAMAMTGFNLFANDAPLVFVLSGQSNMQGVGGLEKSDEAIKVIPAGVSFFENGQPMQDFKGVFNGWSGPEVTAGHALREAIPGREIILVKRAKGGTAISFWTPEKIAEGIAAGDKAPWFNLLIDEVKKAVAGRDVEYGAVFWMQGESDCREEKTASVYAEKLAQLAAAFRKELGAPELPFIYGQINPPTDGPKPHPFRDIVRAQQEKYATMDPRARLVKTDDLSKMKDNLHYDKPGRFELGKRFVQAWAAMQDKEKVKP